jgi:hypothetical protein
MRNATVVGEVALALVLTVAAGLLVRTFYSLLSVDGGFNPEHVLTFELSLSEAKYGNNKDRTAAFYHAALEKLKEVRGIEAESTTQKSYREERQSAVKKPPLLTPPSSF